jgi:FkbM family methyltransferase
MFEINDFSKFREICNTLRSISHKKILEKNPVLIFGAGQFGKDICKVLIKNGIEVIGFVETNPKTKKIMDLPVFSIYEINKEDLNIQVVIGVFNRAAPLNELKNLLNKTGFKDIFMPWDLYSQFEKEMGWRFWLSNRNFILENINSIQEVHDLLSDEESRRTLISICLFRLGVNNDYANFSHEDHQYFNELTLKKEKKDLIYIDGGAYNGDTYIELSEIVDVSSAYLFEPDPENFKKLVSEMEKIGKETYCLPNALSDQYEILSFAAGDGEGAAITDSGSIHIAAVSLDSVFPNKKNIDFIKLDVEGAEIAALNGSRKLLERTKPTLAISLYHKPQDIWEIPLLVNKLCPDYSLYIRQHFSNSFDSVFYAVPNL